MTDRRHHRYESSLDDFTLLEMEHPEGRHHDAVLKEFDLDPSKSAALPESTLVVVTETEKLNESTSLIGSLSDFDFTFTKLRVKNWDGTKMYADYIKQGLEYNNKDFSRVIMLFESPSSSTSESSFHNKAKFRFHDWPPPKSTKSKGILGPCRYS